MMWPIYGAAQILSLIQCKIYIQKVCGRPDYMALASSQLLTDMIVEDRQGAGDCPVSLSR